MKKFLKKIGAGLSSTIKNGAGFTMIELLIVIAVLGVLATAVLSAINPIEQINRGRDTGSRSDSEQLLSAFDRYYTTQELYPWQTKAGAPGDEPVPWQVVDNTWTDGTTSVLSKLSSGGTAELKTSFTTRINGLAAVYKLRVHHSVNANPSNQNSAFVCFQARSGSFKAEALDRCDSTNNRAGGSCAELPADLADTPNCTTVLCSAATPFICLP